MKKIKTRARFLKAKTQKTLANTPPLLLDPGAADEGKSSVEITSLLSKMDVTEELVRMEAHIQIGLKLLKSRGAVGKKMGFYFQEMIREMNTIGSKSQDFKLTQTVISAKSIIEIMREQIQNVE